MHRRERPAGVSEIRPHHVVQGDHTPAEIQRDERDRVQPLRAVLGVQIIETPQQRQRRERNRRLFRKDREVLEPAAIVRGELIQTRRDRPSDGVLALGAVLPIECGNPALV
jgi:hypothetical protein